MVKEVRPCPLCKGTSAVSAFPYAIQYLDDRYEYIRCTDCLSVYVDPVPSAQTFARMYSKSDYHDSHYAEIESNHYDAAANLLKSHAPPGAKVLDYGCGFGQFLRAVRSAGFTPIGVEFDTDAAIAAARNAGCRVYPIPEFAKEMSDTQFDVIHLGDVLEHLPDPTSTLNSLLHHIKAGGLLFVEGPLETNPSPVYWAARLFGTFKHALQPRFVGQGKPTHLFRTGGSQQLDFFKRVSPKLKLIHWEIYETGWPYANSGIIKNLISRVAIGLSGVSIGRATLGNRFTGIFQYSGHP